MPFDAKERRQILIGLIVAVPLELLALWALGTESLDIEPPLPSGILVQSAGYLFILLHYPGVPLLFFLPDTPTMIAGLFLIGYMEIAYLWVMAILVRRIYRQRSRV